MPRSWDRQSRYTFCLTKLQARFTLENALDDRLLAQISQAQATYGIEWIKLDPSMTGLVVEYDATRLRPAELEHALRNHGLAVERLRPPATAPNPDKPAAGI